MPREQIFPSLLILLDAGASGVYWWQGNWRMGTYWLAAATITLMVTI